MQVVEKFGAGDRGRTGDVQLGKTTVNWKQRQLRFLHLVLAIENTPVSLLCSAQFANGAQMEHTAKVQYSSVLSCTGIKAYNDSFDE